MRVLVLAGCAGLFLSGYVAAAGSSPVAPVKDVRLAEWSFAQGHLSGGYWALARVVDCVTKVNYGRQEIEKDVVIDCVKKIESWLDEGRDAAGRFEGARR